MAMVQVVSYPFTIVENPLSDGGNFTTIADANFTGTLEVLVGNMCAPVTATKPGASFYSGSVPAPGNTWPADQYTELTLSTFSSAGNFAYLFLRQGSASSGTQYLANLANAQTWSLFAVVAGIVHTLVNSAAQANAQGDVFRLSITGNVITLSRNGSVVQTFTDINNYVTSGSPGFGLLSAGASTNNQTDLWAAGANQAAAPTFSPNGGTFAGAQTVTITSASGGTIYFTTDGTTPTHSSMFIFSGGTAMVIATGTLKAITSANNFVDSGVSSASFTINSVVPYSVPDCRNYSIFPNNSVTVNQTKTYTVPANPSYVAPVDSRTAGAPVDCRKAPNIPENSRTPGTFGPND